MKKFRALCDSKPGLVSEETAEVFSTITQKCCEHNYKRRCTMDQVSILQLKISIGSVYLIIILEKMYDFKICTIFW